MERITYTNGTYSKSTRSYTGFNSCFHEKWRNLTPEMYRNGKFYRYNTYPYSFKYIVDQVIAYGLSQAYMPVDFIEDNSFDLIPFLLEWDETVATFSMKFWKELSYGSITWGLMPLISDLKSLFGTLSAINGKILSSYQKIVGKKISRRFSWTWNHPTPRYAYTYKARGTTSIQGYITGGNYYPDDIAKAGAVLLDELGANLDLRVVWDVIPFSFVVDYFLPVGDFIESFHPRGWFKPSFVLTGGKSVKAEIECKPYAPYSGGPANYSLYWRQPGAMTLPARPPVEPKFSAPTFRQLFNTMYLSQGRS